jgi:hypothetical protein
MSEDIVTLKAEIAAMQARLAALEERGGRRVIPEAPVEERGVRIYNPPAVSGFVMPNEVELKRLGAIVIANVPWVADVSGPGFHGSNDERVVDWMKQYRASFMVLAVFSAPSNQTTKFISAGTSQQSKLICGPFVTSKRYAAGLS